MKKLAIFVLLFLSSAVLAFDSTPGPVSPDGTRAAIDIPASEHIRNRGGSDGSGLCVYSSVTLAARWQNVQSMYGFRTFAEGRPGGSHPTKLASDITAYCKRNNIDQPPYVQHTGGDVAFLDLCIKTRRAACITYAGLDGYYTTPVSHMVVLGGLDATHGCILDNNRPGSWVWGSRSQIANRWKGRDDSGRPILAPFRDGWSRIFYSPIGGGWVFTWLGPPAPPGSNPPTFTPVDTHEADFGVDSRRLPAGEHYWIGVYEVSQAKAYAAVSDPGDLVDDSDRYHLSIIGEEQKSIDALFSGPLAKYAKRLHIQVYRPTDWVVSRLPAAVTLQEPAKIGGKVVGSGTAGNQAVLQHILSDVFDPPAPAIPVPSPRPYVRPLIPDGRTVPPPKDEPAPSTPVPKPDDPINNPLYLGLGALALAILYKGK